ncbi:MAG TPA: PepSY-associated TM helix domain-containing protein, partial [Sphingomicrobium sp.]
HTGELVAGWAGVAGLVFVITGTILWWRSRRAFRWRLWPDRFKPGPIVAHHRDLGILLAPLLLLSFLTGTGMIFGDAAKWMLRPFGRIEQIKPPEIEPAQGAAPVAAMLAAAKTRFPDAALRRLTIPSKPDQPWSIRMRQSFEWTPNGRTTLYFDGQGKLLRIDDPATGSRAASINETFYPLHSAKVGGLAWKLVMTLSGLGLTLLGSLTTWSFWVRKKKRKPARPASALAAEPA